MMPHCGSGGIRFVLAGIVLLVCTCGVRTCAWLPSAPTRRHVVHPAPPGRRFKCESADDSTHKHHVSSPRRKFLRQFSAVITLSSSAPRRANAACLQGDLRPECIGVYKVPLDDSVLPYVGTKEALKKYAPDLEYVPPIAAPKSLSTALEILETQQLAAQDIKQVVMAGRLEEAGIKILNLIPKITSAGQYILQVLIARTRDSSMVDVLKINMLESQLNNMVALFGECDVEIGQGLRGEMGVSAVAQLTILSTIRDASSALDDFLVTATKLLDDESAKDRQ